MPFTGERKPEVPLIRRICFLYGFGWITFQRMTKVFIGPPEKFLIVMWSHWFLGIRRNQDARHCVPLYFQLHGHPRQIARHRAGVDLTGLNHQAPVIQNAS